MSTVCQWRVPQSVSITYTFGGKTITYTHSNFATFNPLEANCPEYRIKRIRQLMSVVDPRASTPWALATAGPNSMVMGFLPIDNEDPFQTFGQFKGEEGIILPEWQPRNPYCLYEKPKYVPYDPGASEIGYGLGAIPSTALFNQACLNPLCPDPINPDPENPDCDTITTTGWITTGVAANWRPQRGTVPSVCVPVGHSVDFTWTDFANPNGSIYGTAILRNGIAGTCQNGMGQPLGDVFTETTVTFP